MKYFIDTEFIEDGHTIDLISIGIVWESGSYYAVSNEFDESKANDWVKENVLPKLPAKDSPLYKSRKQIKEDILAIVAGTDNKPIFYGYYADYDWVVFCQLFGRMIDLPTGWPMYCRDVKQIIDTMGDPKLPKQPENEHNALDDATWIMQAYDYLGEVEALYNH